MKWSSFFKLGTILVILAVIVLVGSVFAYAHISGFLTPLYHLAGLHSLAGHTELPNHAGHPVKAPEGHGDHSAHGGSGDMTIPGAKTQTAKVPGYSIVQISPIKQQLIGVKVGTVKRDNLLMSIRTVGILEPDQTRMKRIHPRIKGWVTRVQVNYVGQKVQKGDSLLELYSPDLLATQEEYLIALEGLKISSGAMQKKLVEDSLKRLELFGVPPDAIQKLKETGKAQETLTLRSPISGSVLVRTVQEGDYVEPTSELYQIADLSVLWIQAKIYEHELPHIEEKQPVEVTLPSQPGKVFLGKVSFIEPVLQALTRTVKVRVAIDNTQGLFKPGMFADLTIKHDMGTGLLVPESAVLRTGPRDIAFKALSGGFFEPVEVKLGGRFGDYYEVLDGLEEGDAIVVSGNFLIDSDSKLKAAAGMMGHQH